MWAASAQQAALLRQPVKDLCEQNMGGGRDILLAYDIKEHFLDPATLSIADRNSLFSSPKVFRENMDKYIFPDGMVLNQIPNKEVRALLPEASGLKLEDFDFLMATKGEHSTGDRLTLTEFKKLKASPELTDKALGKYVRAKYMAVCGLTQLNSLQECAGNLEKIYTWAQPVIASNNITNFMLPELYENVFLGSKYTEGLKVAAKKIVTWALENNLSSNDNLFSVLQKSFVQTGDSQEVAEAKAMDVLGFISTGGPNLPGRLWQFEYSTDQRWQNIVALGYISATTPMLDSMALEKYGHTFSLPSEVKSSCDNGKLYHFWMTSYFSYRLVKEGSSAKAAATAAFLSEKGYQMLSNTFGRDPDRVFMTKAFGGWNNMIRIDLSLASAGAAFGANLAKGKVRLIDVDSGIRSVFAESKDLPPSTQIQTNNLWQDLQGLPAYERFNTLIAPDTFLKSLLKSM